MWGNKKKFDSKDEEKASVDVHIHRDIDRGKISNDAIKSAIESAKNSSSRAWNQKFAESEQQIKDKHTHRRFTEWEQGGDSGVTGGKSLGDSKWNSGCDGIVPQ